MADNQRARSKQSKAKQSKAKQSKAKQSKAKRQEYLIFYPVLKQNKKGGAVRYLYIIAAMLFFTSTTNAAVTEDACIAGYVTGVLKHGFGMEIPALVAKDDVLTVPEDKLKSDNRSRCLSEETRKVKRYTGRV